MNQENKNKNQNTETKEPENNGGKSGISVVIAPAILAMLILIVAAVYMVIPKENNTPINDVSIVVLVDDAVYEDMAYLEDNVVYIKGEVFNKADDMTMEDIEALGYSVVYDRIGTEITISVNTKTPPLNIEVAKNDTVGVTEVNLDDPANLIKGDDGLYHYNLGAVIGAELMVKDGFKYDNERTMAENVADFQEQMVETVSNISFSNGIMSCLGVGDVSVDATDNSIAISTPIWGTGIDMTSTELVFIINRNLYLNTLNYFGDTEMVKAVYGLIDEHYRFSDNKKEITSEMAEKYGLTISNSKTSDAYVACDVSDGINTWNLSYCIDGIASNVSVLIPIYTKT